MMNWFDVLKTMDSGNYCCRKVRKIAEDMFNAELAGSGPSPPSLLANYTRMECYEWREWMRKELQKPENPDAHPKDTTSTQGRIIIEDLLDVWHECERGGPRGVERQTKYYRDKKTKRPTGKVKTINIEDVEEAFDDEDMGDLQ